MADELNRVHHDHFVIDQSTPTELDNFKIGRLAGGSLTVHAVKNGREHRRAAERRRRRDQKQANKTNRRGF